MIKCNDGGVEISGKSAGIMTDYTLITKALIDSFKNAGYSEEAIDKEIEFAIKLAKANEKDVEFFSKFLEEVMENGSK